MTNETTEKRPYGFANRRCQQCNGVFEGTHRAKYCSVACRVRGHRQRHFNPDWRGAADKALNDMRSAGRSLHQGRPEAKRDFLDALERLEEILKGLRSR